MYSSIKRLAASLILLLGSSTMAQSAIVLDNTSNGTLPLSGNLGSITQTNWNAKVFAAPATGTWTLDILTMGLANSNAATVDIIVRLFGVDGSNNPTGSALASQTFPTSFTSTYNYYDFDLAGNDWSLAPSTTYALVINSSSPDSAMGWTTPTPSNVYTAYEDFAYVGNRRTTSSGASWSASQFYNATRLQATSGTVPTPSVVLLLLPGIAGLIALRRRGGSAGRLR